MNLSITSQFRPFTYDEMVKPLVQYKEVYDKVEQDYSDLVAQTEMWKDIATQENSPEAYAMYNRYSNDLSAIVDDFSRGMNMNNRRALLGMKRRYAQDITPIAQADAAMKEANALRVSAGPDAIFEVGSYNSLDDFLHGKTANNNYQSRDALTKKTAAITEAAMAEALQDPEFKQAMGDMFFIATQHTGGSYNDLMEAMKLGMMDNPIAQNRFSEIRQRVAQQAGIGNYDARGQQAIMDAIDTGLYAGLDKPSKQIMNNPDHITPVQAHQMAMSERQLALQEKELALKAAVARAKASGGGSGKERINTLNNSVMVTIGKEGNWEKAKSGSHNYTSDSDYGKARVLSDKDLQDMDDLTLVDYNELPQSAKAIVSTQTQGAYVDDFDYYITKTDRYNWWPFGDDNMNVVIVPKKSQLTGVGYGYDYDDGIE